MNRDLRSAAQAVVDAFYHGHTSMERAVRDLDAVLKETRRDAALSAHSEAEPPELPKPTKSPGVLGYREVYFAEDMLTFRAEGYSKGVADGRKAAALDALVADGQALEKVPAPKSPSPCLWCGVTGCTRAGCPPAYAAQPAQEDVAQRFKWTCPKCREAMAFDKLTPEHTGFLCKCGFYQSMGDVIQPAQSKEQFLAEAAATQAAGAREPLTREQAIRLWGNRSDGPSNGEIVAFARAIEAAHGIASSAAELKKG